MLSIRGIGLLPESSTLIKQRHTGSDMYLPALSQHGTYPIEILGTTVLVISIVLTLAWLAYLYR